MRSAVIQMTSGKNVDANLEQAFKLLTEAKKQNVQLVVLPEMFACLGVTNQYELASERFCDTDVIGTVKNWAKQFQFYIVAGSMPLLDQNQNESHKVLAASLVFSPRGEVISQYNKIHLFDVDVADEKGRYRESDTFIAGNDVKTASIDGHLLGLSVCYDLRFPELYQQYQAQGCQLITVPSAFTYETGRQHWEVLLRARAIETQSYVLASNQVGVHEDGRRTWGQSMIIAPNGDVLVAGNNDDTGVFVADLDFDFLSNVRSNMPLQQHKKLT
ncbi:MAG: carbon-nitrogen hydrolase family protein [Bermanella sp.]